MLLPSQLIPEHVPAPPPLRPQAVKRMLLSSLQFITSLILLRLAATAEVQPAAVRSGGAAGAAPQQQQQEQVGQEEQVPAARVGHVFLDVVTPMHSLVCSHLEGVEQLAAGVVSHVSQPTDDTASQLGSQIEAVRQVQQRLRKRVSELLQAREVAIRAGAVRAETELRAGGPADSKSSEAASIGHMAPLAYLAMCWAVARSVECAVAVAECAVQFTGVVRAWQWHGGSGELRAEKLA
jgi:hypothetical protein